jgi:hypothetical protein
VRGSGEAVFLSVFVLPILQSASIISASSGGQLHTFVARRTKHANGGKKLWDSSIQYSVQLLAKVMLPAE